MFVKTSHTKNGKSHRFYDVLYVQYNACAGSVGFKLSRICHKTIIIILSSSMCCSPLPTQRIEMKICKLNFISDLNTA